MPLVGIAAGADCSSALGLSTCVFPGQVTVLTQLCRPDHMAATSWDRGKNGAKRPGVFLCQRLGCSWLPASISACSVLWCLEQLPLTGGVECS